MRFRDKVALITAAASGIGRATAEIIAAEGGIIAAVDTDQGRLTALAEAIRGAGGRVHARRADALDQGQVTDVVAGVVRELGRLDILVNAVGGSTIIARPAALTCSFDRLLSDLETAARSLRRRLDPPPAAG